MKYNCTSRSLKVNMQGFYISNSYPIDLRRHSSRMPAAVLLLPRQFTSLCFNKPQVVVLPLSLAGQSIPLSPIGTQDSLELYRSETIETLFTMFGNAPETSVCDGLHIDSFSRGDAE